MSHFWQKPLDWAAGRSYWWRALILLWFLVMLNQNLEHSDFALNRIANPFSALDFGIHELGHVLFSPFGDFMHILGGSLFQCLFPLLWFIGFLQKRWYFAASLCFCWLGLNLYDVATYVADARARLLPLATFAGFGDGSDDAYDQAHDWYQLLSRTHHLNSDLAIAHGLRVAALAAFIVGLVLGAVLIIRMIQSSFKTNQRLHVTSNTK